MKLRPTIAKRQKERARAERKALKAERRAHRKLDRASRVASSEEDPDIAGIVPGPQPTDPDLAGIVPGPPPAQEADTTESNPTGAQPTVGEDDSS